MREKKKLIAVCLLLALLFICFNHYREKQILGTYRGPGKEGEYPVTELEGECFYYDDYNFLNYKSGSVKGMRGIDVSAHQGKIDWKKVKDSGVEFAMIRVGFRSYSDGSLHEDRFFKANLKGAEENHIKTGFYFFSQARNAEEAMEEAEFLMDRIGKKRLSMPIAYDMEEVTADDRILDMTMEEKTIAADAFCSLIKRRGYDPIIYGNPSWISNNLNLSLLTEYPLWLANYAEKSEFPYRYTMWQYTDRGIVGGIKGYVDLNILFLNA